MSDLDPSNPQTQKLPALLKLLKATTTLPAQVTFYASALAAIALIPNVGLPPALAAIAGGVGVNTLSSILERVARGKSSEEEMRQQIQVAIAQSDIAAALQVKDANVMIAKLFRELAVVDYAIQNNELVILQRLSEEAKQHEAVADELRADLAAISVKLDNHATRQQVEEILTLLKATRPSPTLQALHSLPPAPADFTGRAREVDQLLANLAGGAPVAISGLAGMGGVGKTALALFVANELKWQYPDAQIHLELNGTSKTPLSPTEAMLQVIRAFEPTADLRQANKDEIAALYRSLLNEKRALLVFDNAADAVQVAPLLLARPCAVLVTSRRFFNLSGIQLLRLDVLPEADARALLLTLCPRIDGRADEIARLCGYLPLALRTVGSALAEHVDFSPAQYAEWLAERHTRLSRLKSEISSEPDVEAAFELGYDLLDPEVQARWRALAVFPAPFDAAAVASVWKLSQDDALKQLSDLVRASLVEFTPPSPAPAEDGWDEGGGRYTLHDLLAAFADARLNYAECATARLRHAQHFLQFAGFANEIYLKGNENILAALRLFDTEWQHIRAGQDWAATNMQASEETARLCSEYPNAAAFCLDLRLRALDMIAWLEPAAAAAHKLGDKRGEGNHLGNLGNAYADLGDTHKAIEYYEQALAIARDIGNKRGEGSDLGNLGNAYAALGDTHKAIEYHEQALAIARDIGDKRGEGNRLGNLGNAYAALGDTHKAIEYYEQSLAIARTIGDKRGEGNGLGNLGNAYAALGDTHKAIEYYEQALAIARDIGDKRGEGNHLGNLGLAYAILGDTHKAIEYDEQALAIARNIGDKRVEGSLLGNLGNAYADLGDARKAIEYYEQALAIARDIGDKCGEGNHLGNLGLAYADLGDTHEAIEYDAQALAIARGLDDKAYQFRLLQSVGDLLSADATQHTRAEAAYREAIELGSNDPFVFSNLGRLLRNKGQFTEAIPLFEKSYQIKPRLSPLVHLAGMYRQMGDASACARYVAEARAQAPTNDWYDLACLESICNNADAAFENLRRAAQEEKFDRAWAWKDCHLEWIRADPRFAEIVGAPPE